MINLETLVELTNHLAGYTKNEHLFSSLFQLLTIFANNDNLCPEDLSGFKN